MGDHIGGPVSGAHGLWQTIPPGTPAAESREKLYRLYRYGYGYGQVRAEGATNARLRELSRERRRLARASRNPWQEALADVGVEMPEWE